MDWISRFVRELRGSQGLVRACFMLLFLSAAAASTPATASPEQIVAPHQRDELRLPEDYAFPRKAVVQAALAPRPTRPKDIGGFTPKLAAPAGVLVVLMRPSLAPELPLESTAASGAHLWSWTARAPPAVHA